MAAVADRLFPPGPQPGGVWLPFGLSVFLHGLLILAVILVPHFQVGTYIKVPVSYTVSLVDLPPGGRGGAPAPATRTAPTPAPVQVAPPPALQPVPRPTEELTLPGRLPVPKVTKEPEPSLRPPSATGKETLRPAPPPPAPLVHPTPAIPQPAPPAASASPGAGVGAGKASGVEVAGTAAGAGSGAGSGAGGGSALASYLTLVDWKIQQNWVPVGTAASPETVVVVHFRVLRSGQVRDLELERTSGSASLDASALRAVRQSQPLPPFPNLLTEPWLDLRYRFVMERG